MICYIYKLHIENYYLLDLIMAMPINKNKNIYYNNFHTVHNHVYNNPHMYKTHLISYFILLLNILHESNYFKVMHFWGNYTYKQRIKNTNYINLFINHQLCLEKWDPLARRFHLSNICILHYLNYMFRLLVKRKCTNHNNHHICHHIFSHIFHHNHIQ